MELIAATTSALDNIGFTDFTLRINDRRLLTDMIKSAGFGDDDVMPVCIIFDKLDKIGLDGVKDELLGKGYAAEKVEKFIAVISAADDEESALAAAEGFASDASVVEKMRQVLRFAREIAYGRFTSCMTSRWCAAWAITRAWCLKSSARSSARRWRAADAMTT